MNICITSHDLEPQFICGIKRVSSILANEWKKECNIFFIAFSPKNNQVKDINGIPQYHFPKPNNILATDNITYFSQFVKEKKIDIILHQHSDIKDFSELCVKVSKKENIKLITTLHFAITHKNDTIKRSFFIKYKLQNSPIAWIKDILFYLKYNLYTKSQIHKENKNNFHYLINNSDKLVLLSQTHIDELKVFLQLNDAELNKICAINNPLPIINTPDILRKKKKVLWCGRVEFGVKRTDRILEIWKSIAPRHPDWELVIIGSGNIDHFIDITRKYNIPNVVFTGFCDPTEYYKEGSILCMTSSAESWGMVLVEAQMFGCVPIAFNSYSSLPEIISDGINGFKIKAFDKQEYANRLEWLINNENELNKMAIECKKSIRRFNTDIIASQWINLFKSVANNSVNNL